MIVVDMPVAPTTTGASACGPASLTLSATGAGTLNWFDAAIDGTLVNTGTSLTDNFTSTTTYYVQSEIDNFLIENVGPANNTIGGGGYFTNTNIHGLLFNAETDITIVSAYIYVGATANKTITVKDSDDQTVASVTVNVPTGGARVTLNLDVPAGTGYKLLGPASPNMYRNNSGASYPYSIDGVVSITGCTATDQAFYYYFYDIEVEYNNACTSSRTPVTATINPIPTDVTVTGGGTQCGGTATLTATGGTGGTIYWQNTTDNGTSTAIASTSQSVSTSGTYYFRALSGTSCWGNQGSATVTINAVPTAVSVSGGVTQCGGSTTLTATGGTGGTIYWQGTTSGGTSTTTASSSQTVSASGTYYFRSRSAEGCWGPEGSATVTINPLPGDVTVSGAGVQCGGSRTLTATGGTGGTIYWQNTTSNGTSTTTASSSQAVSSSGTYYFRARTTEGCWGNQGSATVTINPAVSASVSTTPESAPGANDGTATAVISAGTAPYSITWQPSYIGNPITALTGGNYCVTVQDFYNCTATACGTVSTNGAAPVADFSADVTEGCDNITVSFTDESSNFPTSWAWDFGDGATSTEQNPVHEYTTVGGHTVSLTATNSSGSDDLILNYYIYVGETPTLELSMTQETLAGNDGTATVNATGGNAPYQWEWNNSSNNSTIIGLTAGEYCVTVTEYGNGCQATACIDVTLEALPAPIADFVADDTEACLSLTVNFTDLSTNNPTEWLWDFGDGATSTEQNPTHAYSTIGVYTVSLTATNEIGSDQEVKADYISVYAKPTLAFEVTNESATGMNDGSIELTITGGAEPYTINWSNSEHTLIITDLTAGVYSVAVIDDNGCMSTGSAEVQVASQISQNLKTEIIIYPNPSNGIFTIEANESITSIQIIDATGRICNEISASDTKVNISTNLVSGVYFVKVNTSENSGLFKMIVQ
jgi:PKD repeat protein